MGFTVYGTASPKNFDSLKTLGASRLFDYKDPDIVSKVVDAVKEDGLVLKHVYRAAGDRAGSDLSPCQQILLKTSGGGKIASAVGPLGPNTPQVEGVTATFVVPPQNPAERKKFFVQVFHEWLPAKLASGEYVPAPKAKVAGKGLDSLSKGLDELRGGVSNVKIVVEL